MEPREYIKNRLTIDEDKERERLFYINMKKAQVSEVKEAVLPGTNPGNILYYSRDLKREDMLPKRQPSQRPAPPATREPTKVLHRNNRSMAAPTTSDAKIQAVHNWLGQSAQYVQTAANVPSPTSDKHQGSTHKHHGRSHSHKCSHHSHGSHKKPEAKPDTTPKVCHHRLRHPKQQDEVKFNAECPNDAAKAKVKCADDRSSSAPKNMPQSDSKDKPANQANGDGTPGDGALVPQDPAHKEDSTEPPPSGSGGHFKRAKCKVNKITTVVKSVQHINEMYAMHERVFDGTSETVQRVVSRLQIRQYSYYEHTEYRSKSKTNIGDDAAKQMSQSENESPDVHERMETRSSDQETVMCARERNESVEERKFSVANVQRRRQHSIERRTEVLNGNPNVRSQPTESPATARSLQQGRASNAQALRLHSGGDSQPVKDGQSPRYRTTERQSAAQRHGPSLGRKQSDELFTPNETASNAPKEANPPNGRIFNINGKMIRIATPSSPKQHKWHKEAATHTLSPRHRTSGQQTSDDASKKRPHLPGRNLSHIKVMAMSRLRAEPNVYSYTDCDDDDDREYETSPVRRVYNEPNNSRFYSKDVCGSQTAANHKRKKYIRLRKETPKAAGHADTDSDHGEPNRMGRHSPKAAPIKKRKIVELKSALPQSSDASAWIFLDAGTSTTREMATLYGPQRPIYYSTTDSEAELKARPEAKTETESECERDAGATRYPVEVFIFNEPSEWTQANNGNVVCRMLNMETIYPCLAMYAGNFFIKLNKKKHDVETLTDDNLLEITYTVFAQIVDEQEENKRMAAMSDLKSSQPMAERDSSCVEQAEESASKITPESLTEELNQVRQIITEVETEVRDFRNAMQSEDEDASANTKDSKKQEDLENVTKSEQNALANAEQSKKGEHLMSNQIIPETEQVPQNAIMENPENVGNLQSQAEPETERVPENANMENAENVGNLQNQAEPETERVPENAENAENLENLENLRKKKGGLRRTLSDILDGVTSAIQRIDATLCESCRSVQNLETLTDPEKALANENIQKVFNYKGFCALSAIKCQSTPRLDSPTNTSSTPARPVPTPDDNNDDAAPEISPDETLIVNTTPPPELDISFADTSITESVANTSSKTLVPSADNPLNLSQSNSGKGDGNTTSTNELPCGFCRCCRATLDTAPTSARGDQLNPTPSPKPERNQVPSGQPPSNELNFLATLPPDYQQLRPIANAVVNLYNKDFADPILDLAQLTATLLLNAAKAEDAKQQRLHVQKTAADGKIETKTTANGSHEIYLNNVHITLPANFAEARAGGNMSPAANNDEQPTTSRPHARPPSPAPAADPQISPASITDFAEVVIKSLERMSHSDRELCKTTIQSYLYNRLNHK